MKTIIRSRHWFGWWWASICSMHREYDSTCGLCNAGHWTRVNHTRLFGKTKWKLDAIENGFTKWKVVK